MSTTLFYGEQWYDYKESRLAAAKKIVSGVPPAEISGGSEDVVVDELVARLAMKPIELDFDGLYDDEPIEADVQVPGFGGRPVAIPGTRVVRHIPFSGEATLFGVSPTTAGAQFIRGEVGGKEVLITWEGSLDRLSQASTELGEIVTSLRKQAQWSASDGDRFNAELRNQVAGWVRDRRAHLAKNVELAKVLKIPKRADPSPQLVPVPQRQPVPVSARPASTRSAPTEWSISDSDYAAIVGQLASAKRLIERLPQTFAPLGEEALRDILLLILNNNFGPAGGEVFSRAGKTDILIHHEQAAVFIAECKNWAGPALFRKALDQLLSYLVWQDTKAALILFVHERDVTGITTKASAEFIAHARYVQPGAAIRDVPTFVLHHEGDPRRHIRIALVVVPIPRVSAARLTPHEPMARRG